MASLRGQNGESVFKPGNFRKVVREQVLEAATVAAEQPPDAVLEFNERDFEQTAQIAHARLGIASRETLNQLLAEFGF